MLPKYLVINDYLESLGNLDFDTFKLNEIDFSIFAVLSYADYEALDAFNYKCDKNEKIPISFFDDKEIIKTLSKRFNNGTVNYEEFFTRFLKAKRYKDLFITNVEKYRDSTAQFFAMTLVINDLKVVVFRGTDNTVAGWKEDVLTCLKNQVFAQRLALGYLRNKLNFIGSKYYIVGHSKGGNLAYYSYFNLEPAKQNRIIKVFNFDGNGFRNDTFDYKKHEKKIVKYLVDSDAVGVLFDHKNNHEIVPSISSSIVAHDLLTWKIDPNMPNSFMRVPELSVLSEAFSRTGTEWFKMLTDEDVRDFVDFIFTIFNVKNPETLKDIKGYLLKSGKEYIKTLIHYEKEKRNRLIVLGGRFLVILIRNIKEVNAERKIKND